MTVTERPLPPMAPALSAASPHYMSRQAAVCWLNWCYERSTEPTGLCPEHLEELRG